MPKIVKEIIQEQVDNLKNQKKEINQKISELKLKEANCSFCKKELPVNKNRYLKNRYKLKFWNNQKQDTRLICYPCLKYGWTRGLPLIDGTLTNPSNPKGSWSKKRTFRIYQKLGYFKENETKI